MDDVSSMELCVQEYILQPLFATSKSSKLDEALKILIEVSRTADGRLDLAANNILFTALQLCQSLSYPPGGHLLLLSLKFLRNLCAGEIANQNSFIEQNGVETVSSILGSIEFSSDLGYRIICMGLQVLGNVVLAGKEHQRAVWHQFFPEEFARIARVRGREACDTLCMILYTCCDGNGGLIRELCGDRGLHIVAEIVQIASAVGIGEDWLKLLLTRICLEEFHFQPLFSKLSLYRFEKSADIKCGDDHFVSEQSFLLSFLSEILNGWICEITISSDFALCVLGIFKKAVEVVNSVPRSEFGLPTGSTAVDVLGYSLIILRDICAQDGAEGGKEEMVDVVHSLICGGLLEMLLGLLRDLEPPALIRKAIKQVENHDGTSSYSSKICPYKGFRRDIVAVIGNCAYHRKHVQDEIRQKNGILLLLQQCVNDEHNTFLREWGIWSVRNLLEGNAENQRIVAELELQASVDVPEIAGLGLRVEVDQRTRRAKLVNAL
ncbi:uncharacterized protein LOC131160096 [Malania oleifera]|uniref:uncharacterized protein LOC131160096 n=1 Tax=Malania oleifera TaxID=397392 RepID=UPI0025AEA91F|nr:uncharacterized protein LOC131160096 [Malania oleifera]